MRRRKPSVNYVALLEQGRGAGRGSKSGRDGERGKGCGSVSRVTGEWQGGVGTGMTRVWEGERV